MGQRMSTLAVVQTQNPYVGPRSFRRDEALYGRDREVQELLDLLIAERIVLLYSPSGAGKTSLVQAALIPALERESFTVRPVMRVSRSNEELTPGTFNRYILSALSDLEEGLPKEIQKAPAELAQMTFEKYLAKTVPIAAALSSNSSKNSAAGEVLIFDQFEEILTMDPADLGAKREFFVQLGSALRDRNRWALFSMREDYIAGLDPYLRLIPTRLRTTYRLDLLDGQEAQQAIQKPVLAMKAGIEFSESAAIKLVNDLARIRVQRPDGSVEEQVGLYVEPVQLQVVCLRLWEELLKRWQSSPSDRREVLGSDLVEVGDVDTALADYYAERVKMLASSDGQNRAIRQWVEDRLITDQGIRSQVLMGADKTEGLDNASVWALVDAHLLRAEKRRGATWFELAHDRLIEPVRKDNRRWLDAHLSRVQRDAAEWEKQHRPTSLLLRDRSLEDGERWAKEHAGELTITEQQFIEACQELQARFRHERKRRLQLWLVTGLAIIAGIWALTKINEARKRENTAQNRVGDAVAAEAAAKKRVEAAEQKEKEANNKAEEATEANAEAGYLVRLAKEKEAQAEKRLRTATAVRLAAQAEEATVMEKRPVEGLLVALESLRTPKAGDPPTTAPEESLRKTLANAGGRAFRGHRAEVGDIAISPDRHWLATDPKGDDCKRVSGELWDLTSDTSQPQSLEGACGPIAISPDGHWIVSGSLDSMARLWDLTSQPTRGPIKLAPGAPPIPPNGINITATGHELITVGSSPNGLPVSIWDLTVRDPAMDTPAVLQEQALALSPDGKWLATGKADLGCKDTVIHLWNLEHPHSNPVVLADKVNSVTGAFSENGGLFVTAGNCITTDLLSKQSSQSVVVWDLSESPPERVALPETSETYRMLQVAISRAGMRVVAETWGEAYLWNLNTPQQKPINLPYQTEAVFMDPLVLSDSGEWLFGFGENKSHEKQFWSWHVSETNPDTTLRSPLGSTGSTNCTGARISHNRWLLLVCEGMMTVMDLTKEDPVSTRRVLVGHEAAITSYDIQGSAHLAATRDGNGMVRLWDLSLDSPIASPLTYSGMSAISSDVRLVAIGSSDGTISVLDLSSKDSALRARKLSGLFNPVQRLTFQRLTFSSDSSRLLAIGTQPHSPRVVAMLWNLAGPSPDPVKIVPLDESSYAKALPSFIEDLAKNVTPSPDSLWVLTPREMAGGSRLWNLADSVPRVSELQPDAINPLFSSDSAWLVTTSKATAEAEVRRLSKNGIVVSKLRRRLGNPMFSPNSRWLFMSSPAGAQIWKLKGEKLGDPTLTLPLVGGDASAIFSPNGDWVLTIEKAGSRLWKLNDDYTSSLSASLGNIQHVWFSPDSHWLFTAGTAGSQIRYLADSVASTIFSSSKVFTDCIFDPDNRRVFVGTHTMDLRPHGSKLLLSLSAEKRSVSSIELPSIELLSDTLINADPRSFAFAVAFSPNSHQLVAFPNLWDLGTGGSLRVSLPTPLPGSDGMRQAYFSPDARWIVGRDVSRVAIWSTRIDEDLVPLACRTAGRNLTLDEWKHYFPGEAYRKTCAEYPAGAGAPPSASKLTGSVNKAGN